MMIMMNYRNNRKIACIVILLFILSNIFPLISMGHDPCEDLRDKVKEWEGKLRDAQRKLRNLRDAGYLASIASSGWTGLGIGGAAGAVAGFFGLGGVGAGPVGLAGGFVGGLTGIFYGAVDHYAAIKSAEQEVEYARNTLNGYIESLQRCESKHRNHKHECMDSGNDYMNDYMNGGSQSESDLTSS